MTTVSADAAQATRSPQWSPSRSDGVTRTADIPGFRLARDLYLTTCVTPSDLDGLHCGRSFRTMDDTYLEVTPSDLDGLHCGCAAVVCSGSVAVVTPSDLDGLHCGTLDYSQSRRFFQVTPSDLDGLHCG